MLVVPETETALARGIGLTNQVYTQYLNRKLSQSGRIWQNRFFSCVVDNDQYLWAVVRYIESNPVKVGLTLKAQTYRWSSAKVHLSKSHDRLLHEPSWLEPAERVAYGMFFRSENEDQNNAIRKATRTGRPFGSEEFVDRLEFQLDRILKARKVGRPRTK